MLFTCLLLVPGIRSFAQQPLFFVDSARVATTSQAGYPPADIASVTVLSKSKAVKWLGDEGRNGAVIIMTKAFARKHYWQFFAQRSADYARAVTTPGADSTVQYILNDVPLKNNFEADLLEVDEHNLVSLVVISGTMLEDQFQISGKRYGVVIKTGRP